MYKTFKIILLPSKKESTSFSLITNTKGELRLPHNPFKYNTDKFNIEGFECYNLYIISDDEIKEGDWMLSDLGSIGRIDYSGSNLIQLRKICKKIIATTDKSLTKREYNEFNSCCHSKEVCHCGLPQLPESSIQAYIKAYNEGKPITEVALEMEMPFGKYNNDMNQPKYILKINKNNEIIIK